MLSRAQTMLTNLTARQAAPAFHLNKEEFGSLTSQSAIAKPPSGRGGRLRNLHLRIRKR